METTDIISIVAIVASFIIPIITALVSWFLNKSRKAKIESLEQLQLKQTETINTWIERISNLETSNNTIMDKVTTLQENNNNLMEKLIEKSYKINEAILKNQEKLIERNTGLDLAFDTKVNNDNEFSKNIYSLKNNLKVIGFKTKRSKK